MNPTNPTPQSTVVIRSAEDLLAHIPCVLGFVPHDSVVLVACSGGAGMHARVDLPVHEPDRAAVTAQFRAAAAANSVSAVALVLYTAHVAAARAVLGDLAAGLLAEGVTVDVALRVADDRWFLMLPEEMAAGTPGVPFDISAHPLVTRSVLAGQVTHASRADLVASVAPAPERVAAVQAALADAPTPARVHRDVEVAWAKECVLKHVDDRSWPVGTELARLLRALRHEEAQEELVCVVTRAVARRHAHFWAGLLPGLPPGHVAPAGGLLALCAWVAGDGALAWCAIDRVNDSPGTSAVGDFVAVMLQRAVPPSVWGPSAA